MTPTICPHDSLRRSCPICERDDEIAELRKRVADAERERDEVRLNLGAPQLLIAAAVAMVEEACGFALDAGREIEHQRDLLRQTGPVEYLRLRALVTAAHSALPPKWPEVRGECVGCGAPLFCTNDHAVRACWAETVADSLDEALHPDRSDP